MLSVAGGKLTTHRRIARSALHALRTELGGAPPRLAATPLPGACDRATVAAGLERRHPAVSPELARHLARTYGSLAGEVLACAAERTDALEPLAAGGLDVVAQALYARDREWANDAEDVLRRRTTLALRGLDTPALRERVQRAALGGCARARAAAGVILAIDQGTTGTTCLVVDRELRARGRGYAAVEQHFPQPGWVEHDPEQLWRTVEAAAAAAVQAAGVHPSQLTAIGIANQRETTLLWERESGRPVGRAIVWQDRRTAERCASLPAELIRSRTGLVPDPYFSATKLEWLLARTELPAAELAFGTVDAWLLWKLTGGALHATDVTNASRTLLLDLATLDWDDELLALFGVDRAVLPALRASSGVVGEGELLGVRLPIAGIAGDQQASLFGHGCFGPGRGKATYGTGSFVLAHAGGSSAPPPAGLLKTAAAGSGAREYALEGAILASGAAVQWLRDGLGLVETAAETESLARSVASSDGVYFVPALAGLGSPHWAPDARGLVCGITRGTTRAHLVRAALEAIAFQVADVLDVLPEPLEVVSADGGATANAFLMQFQADVLGRPVEVAAEPDTTALGAAALAGLAIGTWESRDEIAALQSPAVRYEPALDPAEAARLRDGWRAALGRALLEP